MNGLFNNDMFSPQEEPKQIPQYIQKRIDSSNSGNESSFKAPINWEQVKYLIRMFCTLDEIAGFFNLSPGTLRSRVVVDGLADSWKDFYKTHSGFARASLRRAQYEKAVVEKHPNLLIWLGKNYLSQADKQIVLNEDPEDDKKAYDLSMLSDEELNKMEDILKKAEVEPGEDKEDE